ncbi:MAG: colanic acid exporter, partial [Phototrophicales bacterium]
MSLRQQVLSSAKWAVIGNTGKYAIFFIVLIILARILSPREFGLVAMAQVFSGFAGTLNELGFGAALVQRQTIEERHRSSVFWLSLLIGIGLTLALMLSAPFIAMFYNEPRLVPIVFVISLYFTIGAFASVQTSLLQRDLAFRHIALIDIGTNLFGGLFAIGLAILGAGVWAIVSQNMAMIIARVVVMWLTVQWRPRRIWDRHALRELMGFSLNLVGIKSLNYWIASADNLLIGRFTNPVALGLYTRAYSVMLQPLKQITWILGRVMFPALSRIQHDQARTKAGVLNAQRLIAFLTMPMMAGLIVVAEDFVLVVFGEQWTAMTPILRILCLVAIIQPMTETVDWIYRAQGRTDIYFKWGLFTGTVSILSFVIGLNWGVQGVATAYAIVTYLLWYPTIAIAGRLIQLSFITFFQNISSIMLITAFM